MLNITDFIATLLSLTVDKVTWKSILEIQNDPSFRFFYPLIFFWKDRHDPKKEASRVRFGAQEVGSGDCHQGAPRILWPKIFQRKWPGQVEAFIL